MAIRYDRKLTNEINRIVRNYNAKIRRLEKVESDVILPDKFTKESLASLKGSVSNRADLRRRLKDLETFTERGAEKNIIVDNTSIPKYQYKNIRRYQGLVKRRINTKIKFYETKKPTNKGEAESATFAQMGERDYLNALAKRKLLLEKDLASLSNEEREKFLELLQSNARTRSANIWKENYLDILVDTGRTYGFDDEKLQTLEQKLSKLTPAQFDKLATQERTIQQILYYYKPIKDLGVDVALDNMADDAIANFDNLYNNIDEILKDYE